MDDIRPAGAPLPDASVLGALVALAGATCCILPMVFVMAGLGGSWLAVFSPIAGVSPYLLGGAAALVLAGWISVRFRPKASRVRWALGLATAATAVAHGVYLYRDTLTDMLMGAA